MGLRTLDPADLRYRGRYQGNLFERDGAYHQGTVWPWLLGPLAEAMLRAGAFSDASRRAAADALTPILRALTGGSGGAAPAERPGAIGQVAEVFDGDEPRRAQGCPAQAWSVAELLRAIVLVGG
jgi:glycogen debranching enzyme